MKLRAVLLLIGCILAVATGQHTCRGRQKCVPMEDCTEYKSYVNTTPKSWPKNVLDELKGLVCGREQVKPKKIYKFCCNPKTVNETGDLNSLTSSGKSGRDLLDLKICGTASQDRIISGNIAHIFEYPWMALLGNQDGEFHCGGSLIAESFVLTAAHCNQRKISMVRVGETDLSTPIDCNDVDGEKDCAEPYQDIQVEKFIRHIQYSTSQKKNDIALIKLKTPAQLNYNVRPICLPLPELLPSKLPDEMEVSGWGFTADQNATSLKLRRARIPIIEQDTCQQSIRQYHDVYSVDETQVCATRNAGNCAGDNGGPLQYFGNKSYVIHGIVSWELSTCGKDSAPGIYTKVAHYLDWIIDNLK